jgi:hypothetical protein
MTSEKTANRNILVFCFAVFTLLPSFDTALKYGGPLGVLAYFVAGTAVIFAADRFIFPLFNTRVSERTARILALITIAGLAILAAVVHPMIDSKTVGTGSDADDALVTAATELLAGRYPYTLSTYLGNLISPMPGSVILAIPFVAAGAIYLQNVLWIAVFLAVLSRIEKSTASAVGLVWAMLAFSPTLLQNVVTGADYASNSIYIVVSMWIMLSTIPAAAKPLWTKVLPAILLGIALSSRSTFILVMPLFLAVLVQRAGWSKAIGYLSISGIAFLVVTLPFWIVNPSGFAPFTVQSEKLKFVEEILPFAGVIVPAVAGLMACLLAFQDMKTDTAKFFRNCAIVQIVVLFVTSALYTVKLGQLDFFLQQSGYGMFTLFFGATAFWMYLNKTDSLGSAVDNR